MFGSHPRSVAFNIILWILAGSLRRRKILDSMCYPLTTKFIYAKSEILPLRIAHNKFLNKKQIACIQLLSRSCKCVHFPLPFLVSFLYSPLLGITTWYPTVHSWPMNCMKPQSFPPSSSHICTEQIPKTQPWSSRGHTVVSSVSSLLCTCTPRRTEPSRPQPGILTEAPPTPQYTRGERNQHPEMEKKDTTCRGF